MRCLLSRTAGERCSCFGNWNVMFFATESSKCSFPLSLAALFFSGLVKNAGRPERRGHGLNAPLQRCIESMTIRETGFPFMHNTSFLHRSTSCHRGLVRKKIVPKLVHESFMIMLYVCMSCLVPVDFTLLTSLSSFARFVLCDCCLFPDSVVEAAVEVGDP